MSAAHGDAYCTLWGTESSVEILTTVGVSTTVVVSTTGVPLGGSERSSVTAVSVGALPVVSVVVVARDGAVIVVPGVSAPVLGEAPQGPGPAGAGGAAVVPSTGGDAVPSAVDVAVAVAVAVAVDVAVAVPVVGPPGTGQAVSEVGAGGVCVPGEAEGVGVVLGGALAERVTGSGVPLGGVLLGGVAADGGWCTSSSAGRW